MRDTIQEFCMALGLKINERESKAFCSLSVSRSIRISIYLIFSISFIDRLERNLDILLQGCAKCEDFHFVI